MVLKDLTTAILNVMFAIAYFAYKVIQCSLIEHFVLFSYGSICIDGVRKFFHETGFLPGPISKYYIGFLERFGLASTILDMEKSKMSQSQGQSDCNFTPSIRYIPQIFVRWICYWCALNCKNATIFGYPGRFPWWSYLRCLELPVLVNLNTKLVRIDFRGVSGELIAVWERGSDSKWFISWQHDIANTQACMDTSDLLRDVQGRKPFPLFTSGWLLSREKRGYLDPETVPSGKKAPWISELDEDAMSEAFDEICEKSPGSSGLLGNS